MAMILVSVLVVSGCTENEAIPTPMVSTINTNDIPSECAEFAGDVCELFDCMVDECECNFFEPVLQESEIAIASEEDAVDLVTDYVNNENIQFTGVITATKLNDMFYNVFVTDSESNEEVYTVSTDGAIIKTVCYV